MANKRKTGCAGRAELWIVAAVVVGALLFAFSGPAIAAASSAHDPAPASSNKSEDVDPEFGVDLEPEDKKQHDNKEGLLGGHIGHPHRGGLGSPQNHHSDVSEDMPGQDGHRRLDAEDWMDDEQKKDKKQHDNFNKEVEKLEEKNKKWVDDFGGLVSHVGHPDHGGLGSPQNHHSNVSEDMPGQDGHRRLAAEDWMDDEQKKDKKQHDNFNKEVEKLEEKNKKWVDNFGGLGGHIGHPHHGGLGSPQNHHSNVSEDMPGQDGHRRLAAEDWMDDEQNEDKKSIAEKIEKAHEAFREAMKHRGKKWHMVKEVVEKIAEKYPKFAAKVHDILKEMKKHRKEIRDIVREMQGRYVGDVMREIAKKYPKLAAKVHELFEEVKKHWKKAKEVVQKSAEETKLEAGKWGENFVVDQTGDVEKNADGVVQTLDVEKAEGEDQTGDVEKVEGEDQTGDVASKHVKKFEDMKKAMEIFRSKHPKFVEKMHELFEEMKKHWGDVKKHCGDVKKSGDDETVHMVPEDDKSEGQEVVDIAPESNDYGEDYQEALPRRLDGSNGQVLSKKKEKKSVFSKHNHWKKKLRGASA